MSCVHVGVFFFFKQKTAYEMRISDWSSDVCSSDLASQRKQHEAGPRRTRIRPRRAEHDRRRRDECRHIGRRKRIAPAAGKARRTARRELEQERPARERPQITAPPRPILQDRKSVL